MPDSPSESTALAITWDDVLNPETSVSTDQADLFVGLQLASSQTDEFSLVNACFLAAHSHLIYSGYSDSQKSSNLLGRHTILERLGLEESFCGEFAGTVCSIVEPAKSTVDSGPATVVFRGSCNLKNWLTNVQGITKEWSGGGHVHSGFASAQEEIWDHLGPRLEALVGGGRPLFVTGHSYGGALAALTLSQLHGRHPDAKASAYTFGCPRVGNEVFAKSMSDLPLYRIVNNHDLATRVPLPFSLSRRMSYCHAGDAYFLDSQCRIQSRGQGDLAEESASLGQIGNILRHLTEAFKESRPPDFLADHAPLSYLESIRRAHANSKASG